MEDTQLVIADAAQVWPAEKAGMLECISELEAQLRQAEASKDTLRAALKPFTAHVESVWMGNNTPMSLHGITAGDLRRARAALADTGAEVAAVVEAAVAYREACKDEDATTSERVIAVFTRYKLASDKVCTNVDTLLEKQPGVWEGK